MKKEVEMKSMSFVFLISLLFTTGLFSKNSYRKGELIIHLNSPITISLNRNSTPLTNHTQINEIIHKYRVKRIYRLPFNVSNNIKYYYHIDFDCSKNIENLIEEIQNLPVVIAAQPNYLFKLHSISNDSLIDYQWALRKINIADAWNIEPGDSNIIVAVLDAGVDLGLSGNSPHPDLGSNLLQINNKYGINIIDSTQHPIDYEGHGTHVSGIIGALINNNKGIAGAANCKLLNVKIVKDSVSLGEKKITVENVALGIYKSIACGAKIINMCFGVDTSNTDQSKGLCDVLDNAIEDAYNNGIVLVASIGNDGQDFSGLPDSLQMYPAYYPEVISVCAVDSNDYKYANSSYSNWVDIAAPGGFGGYYDDDDILSTTPRYEVNHSSYAGWTSTYGYLCGTSMAAPYVSGLAALLLSYEPDLPPQVVRDLIKQTSDNIDNINSGQSWEGKLGAGRINAFSALQLLQNSPSTPTGLTSSNSGGHPLIYWNKNDEADLKEYKVKRILYNWIGLPFKWETLTSYFTISDTFYQDNSFSIGSDKDKVYYSVCAVDYCNNSSNYTSCVMYQGTSPLWKTTGNVKDTIIYSDPNLDGRVCTYPIESADDYWVDNDYSQLLCGDNEDQFHWEHECYHSYLSFDISFLSDSSIIKSTDLIVYQLNSIGNSVYNYYPRLCIDGMMTYCTISHIIYGDSLKGVHWTAGDEGDSLTLESNIGYISTTPDIGFRSVDVTKQIKIDIQEQRKYCQFRLAFPIKADQDEATDLLYFYSADSDSQQYWPRLEIQYQTSETYQEPINEIPNEFCLLPNYPNPFNANTTIRYEIPETSPVILSICDINGRLIKVLENTMCQPGKYTKIWDATNISSGVYLIRIQAGSFQQVRKCLLIK